MPIWLLTPFIALVQHLRSLVGQTDHDSKLPLVPVPNVTKYTWGPFMKDGRFIPATHRHMGDPNADNDEMGLGRAVKNYLRGQASSVGVRWELSLGQIGSKE